MDNLIGKSFKNGKGEVITVIDIDSDVAILNNQQRISINRLIDQKNYRSVNTMQNHINENIQHNESEIPLNIFSNSDNRYSSLMTQLKTSVDKNPFLENSYVDNSNLTSIKVVDPTVDLGDKSYAASNDEKSRLDALKQLAVKNQQELNKKLNIQNQKLVEKGMVDDEIAKLPEVFIDDVDIEERGGVQVAEYNPDNIKLSEKVMLQLSNIEEKNTFAKKENPAYEMFKNVKRSIPFKMSLELSKLLPKKEFIQMWEESYEISMIEYLAEEFLRELLSNPETLKIQIIEKMNEQIFPKKVKRIPTKKKNSKAATNKKEIKDDK